MSTPDPGLANERTVLAWQRTALSLAVGSAVLVRLSVERLGPVAVAGGAIAFVLSIWVVAESRWRYAQARGVRRRQRGRGGRAAASLAVATCVLAVLELLAIARS